MKSKENIIIYSLLALSTALILYLYKATEIEYFLELSGTPFEILVTVFILDRFFRGRESREKRRRLTYIKGFMFRSDMRKVFIANVNAVQKPALTISFVRGASLDELKEKRSEANNQMTYPSPEAMEKIIDEYVRAESVWKQFLDLALANDFEDVFNGMVYILHFIQDVKLFKERNPNALFIHEAQKNPHLMQKVDKILGDGIRSFLDYAIQLKENHPELFQDVFSGFEENELAA
ncbi:MAG TPA: hypothetical protein PJ991_01160 [Kiritimatiellia bacterium]|nr:hypothetical protein [Kiritimatiellia bacterium]